MLFPVLDIEERVQINDKTRLNARQSFLAPITVTPETVATVAPGYGVSAIDIFDATTKENWYLDWIFNSWTFDIVTGFNDKIDVFQGTNKVATLTQGAYTLAALLTEIATRLNAIAGISGTFTVTSDSKDRITVTNDSSGFTLLGLTGDNLATSLLPHIGIKEDLNGASVTGKPVEYAHRQITLSVNNGGAAQTVTKYVKLFSIHGDSLFSSDQDLITWEPDIMRWVQSGRSSYINIHREAQGQLLYWLDKEGYTDVYQSKYTKFALIDVSEVNETCAFLALSIIFWGISNKTDDVFLKKHFEYKKKYIEARDRAVLRLDVDADGKIDLGEQMDIAGGVILTK